MMITPHDDDMPDEIDFSKGERGKFFRPGMRLNLPVYLDSEVQARLATLASAKGVELPPWSTICSGRIAS
jgi:hypothetical protein